jgi:hypothetical protein
MIDFILETLVPYLDRVASLGIDQAGLGDNKHFIFACMAVDYYYDDLKEAAAKSETTIDDALVEEAYQIATKYLPE